MNRRLLTLALISGTAFVSLALLERIVPGFAQSFDSGAAQALSSVQTLGWIQASLIVTALGSTTGIIVVALGSVYFLRAHPGLLYRLVFVLLGTTAVANLTKILVSRTRPEVLPWFDPLLTYSFPSGHATASMALYAFLAAVSYRLLRGSRRTLAIACCCSVILAVGISRLVLNAHYLSDVAGGYLLGLAFVALAFSIRSAP